MTGIKLSTGLRYLRSGIFHECSWMPYSRRLNRSYRRKTLRGKRTRARRTYRRISRIATKAVMKKAETKYAVINRENVQLYHNVGETGGAVGPYLNPYTDATFFNCWSLINTGTAAFNRIGNEIYPRGMSIRLWLANKSDRPNLHYRVVIGTLPKTNVAGAVTTATNFQWIENYFNVLQGFPNHDAGVKLFYDKVVRNEIGTSFNVIAGASWVPRETHKFLKIFIKRKRSNKITYAAGTNVIYNKPVFMAVIPYDSYGTLVTDNVASMAYSCKLYWKDC